MESHRREVRARGGIRVVFGGAIVAALAAVIPAPAAVRTVPAQAASQSSSSRRPDDAQSAAECKGSPERCPDATLPVFAAEEIQARSGARRDEGVTGRVEGTVTLGPRLKARKMRFALYPQDAQQALVEARASQAPKGDRDDEFRNVVVYVENAPSLEPAARAAATNPPRGLAIRQDGLAFVPHVLPVLRGTTVDFPNTDPVFHNVFSLARAATFDLGRYPRGDARSVRFDTPGIVKVFCHIHSDMSAVVMVLDNPYFVAPDADGRFRLDGLPPGEYKVVAWHERARPARRNVRVEPGRATTVTFDIPLSEEGPGD
ncbi:MAG TPA: carboxypeptidase regulatory-like domain-containing protein [Candidatus Polarisedimenticolia bacterium]|nr:carboxypeptidase regulatory-like domain-containing protein [Candidatus Polarisedimenticolia bacterium]